MCVLTFLLQFTIVTLLKHFSRLEQKKNGRNIVTNSTNISSRGHFFVQIRYENIFLQKKSMI
jgi:hypothetical protein